MIGFSFGAQPDQRWGERHLFADAVERRERIMTLRSVLSAVIAALILVSGAPAVAQPKTALDRCVPADLTGQAISFRTEDHVVLPGLVFGGGSRGVLLAHSGFEPICGPSSASPCPRTASSSAGGGRSARG